MELADLKIHLNRLSRRASGGCPVARDLNHSITGLPDYSIPCLAARGFTLIELVVVLSIIIILATVGLAQYKNSVMYAKEAVLHDDLNKMREAIDQYYADKGKYPSALDSLVSDGYLRKLPDDPITNSSGSWQAVPAEPDPGNPTAEPGVYDVKSGAQGTALDGKSYADF